MTWIDQLDVQLRAAKTALNGLNSNGGVSWVPDLLASLADLQDRSRAIRHADSCVPKPDARMDAVDSGLESLITLPIPDEFKERSQQLNAFRIAILDLNEICDELTHNYWISLFSLKHVDADLSIAGSFLSRTQIRRAMKKSCEALIPGGHGNLDTLRNSFVHLPFQVYATRLVPQSRPRAGRPLVFEFVLPDDNGSDYARRIFQPLSQLGERTDSGQDDFSSAVRRDLSAALCSSGRMAVDVAAAFVSKITAFGGQN